LSFARTGQAYSRKEGNNPVLLAGTPYGSLFLLSGGAGRREKSDELLFIQYVVALGREVVDE
jgi:hypothetical protein